MLKTSRTNKMLTAFILVLSTFLVLVSCGSTSDGNTSDLVDNSTSDVEETGDNTTSDVEETGDESDVSDTSDDSSTNETVNTVIGDTRLVGDWTCVSLDNKGSYTGGILYGYDAEFYVMNNGQCYGSLIKSLYKTSIEGNWVYPLATLDVNDGEFIFKDVTFNGNAELDIKATYTISDITKSSITNDDDVNDFHSKAVDDQLTIHFTGSLKTSPTEIQTIDFTIIYEKSGIVSSNNEGILWSAMCGKWTDNYGNAWTFMANETNGLEFTMISEDKVYPGKRVTIGAYIVNGEMKHLMTFYYEDEGMSDISQAEVISFDGKELCLMQSNGQTLTFSK